MTASRHEASKVAVKMSVEERAAVSELLVLHGLLKESEKPDVREVATIVMGRVQAILQSGEVELFTAEQMSELIEHIPFHRKAPGRPH